MTSIYNLRENGSMSDTLGTILQQLREKRFGERSKRLVGEKIGVKGQYIGMIEGGKRKPSLARLERLAEVLGTSVGIIMLLTIDPVHESMHGLQPDLSLLQEKARSELFK